MAQFGRHLFGTSLFGKSNAFIGTYDTRIVDAGEPFDGSVEVSLDHTLPSKLYTHDEDFFHYNGETDTIGSFTTLQDGASVTVYISGRDLEVIHGEGRATVSVIEQETQEERTYTTDDSGRLPLENFPEKGLQNYTVTITADGVFRFEGIRAQTTEIQGLVRATTEEMGRTDYFLQGDWPLGFQTEAMEEHDSVWIYSHKLDFELNDEGRLVASTDTFEQARFVQVKLVLLTTDSDTSPSVDEIHFYSGDLSKFRSNGRWQTTLDMKNIAADAGKTFQRVDRMEWVEREEEQSRFDLHSSSRNGNTPSILNIMNDSYWSDLTAKYTLKHNGETYGEPYGRASLNQRNNGYSESASLGSVFFGPINPLEMGFTNTEVDSWHSFIGKHYYPRNSNNAELIIEFYEQKNDIENGVPPVFILDNPRTRREYLVDIANTYDNLYVRIVFERDTSYSTAVVDDFHLYVDLDYESARTSNNYTDELSALDGFEEGNTIGEGRKLVRRLPLNVFDWPNRNQHLAENRERILDSEKRVRVTYNPRYLNQVFLGLGQPDTPNQYFTRDYPDEFQVHSQVYAEEPVTSTEEVPADQLFWHYSYDGGTVNFPITTYRDLTTQFTPAILQKKYRYYIKNGWSDQTFKVPYTMSLKEAADLTLSDEKELTELNSNVPLYDDNVLTGYVLKLPNNTLNPIINLRFETSEDIVTDYSVLNETTHDRVEAWIEESDSYQYLDWTSDEIMFNGVINYNDEQVPYVRTQNSAYNVLQQGNHTVSLERETAFEIAARYNVNLEDLLVLNDRQEVFERNDVVIVPGGYSLPDIAPGLIYEGDNPYVIEIIPGSVRRTKGDVRLDNDVLVPGSDDEDAISYTLTESNTETIFIRRGEVRNGRDHLPVSNVIEVHEIRNYDTGLVYVPATSTMGDYRLEDGHVDWSPSFSNSKEPEENELYEVTLTRGVVDNLRIVYTSNYVERMSQDRMEAIPVLSDMYEVDLREDMLVTLPTFEEMQERYPQLRNMRYVAENSDLWVNAEIDENEIRLTLNGEDPNVNWYPTIQTGFYYLNDQEHYLYSRPTETVFNDQDIPVIQNVEYTDKGLRAPQDN